MSCVPPGPDRIMEDEEWSAYIVYRGACLRCCRRLTLPASEPRLRCLRQRCRIQKPATWCCKPVNGTDTWSTPGIYRLSSFIRYIFFFGTLKFFFSYILKALLTRTVIVGQKFMYIFRILLLLLLLLIIITFSSRKIIFCYLCKLI